jgi:hypothetical protein
MYLYHIYAGSYASSYQTYEAGTKRLTTWLVQAGTLCDVAIILSNSQRISDLT